MAASTHVALLRGINVGGNNKLPMKDLAALFAESGCTEVRTYIQSGNVVFQAPASRVKTLGSEISEAISSRLKLKVPVVLRSAAELAAVTKKNPFLEAGPPEALHVLFLADAPSRAQVDALDPARSPPDEFAVHGREVYLRCPNGVGNTKLTNAYFDSKLKTVSTGRNWKTVLTLLEMCGG